MLAKPFDMETDRKSAKVILYPVPWEATVSYGGGTQFGPDLILKAGPQLDLFDVRYQDAFEAGYFMEEVDRTVLQKSEETKKMVERIRSLDANDASLRKERTELTSKVNSLCQGMVDHVFEQCRVVREEGRLIGVVGGDHSTALGSIWACSEKHPDYGILHFDAHADLRESYEGFTHSHASIMYNVMKLKRAPQRLVQVGIRDFCQEEWTRIKSTPSIQTFFDADLKSALFAGESWGSICTRILEGLPKSVYVSFDIDGLSPELCPGTGTPVPGGLSFDQATHLLSLIKESGRKLIGFDLCEVAAPCAHDEWNGNVGARILLQLCHLSATTHR